MNCKVYYEFWQMQCCGDPFKIGDTVKWPVVDKPQFSFGFEVLDDVDYVYEAHDHIVKRFHFTGVVTRIWGVYMRYEPSKEDPRFLTPVYSKLFKTNFADGNNKAVGDLELGGYVIELENCSLS